MSICRIVEESPAALAEYCRVPITFEVRTCLEMTTRDAGLGGIALEERPVAQPYVKEYDAIESERPSAWPDKWDLTNWGILAAWAEDRRVGGCAVAYDTPGLDMLAGRKDMAALMDIRVDPAWRGTGVGSLLFERVESWARQRGCNLLKIETQNNNVLACRFYARMGCELGAIVRYAYKEYPREVQLLWYKDL
jgi:GNAT superfamily N-acetyltransferase